MNAKKVIRTVLFLFIVASLGFVVLKEFGVLTTDQGTKESSENSVPLKANHLVVYYFHGNVRCDTCRKIETLANESLKTHFSDALKNGRLEWRVINTEEPSNEHFVDEFDLTSSSVVVAHMDHGGLRNWKNLDQIWELVAEGKDVFESYIAKETKQIFGSVGP